MNRTLTLQDDGTLYVYLGEVTGYITAVTEYLLEDAGHLIFYDR